VRVEPEEVLEEQRIAAAEGVQHRQTEPTIGHDEHERHGQNRRRQDHHETRRVNRPDEQRQAKPGQTRGAQSVGRRDEIDARRNGAETSDDHADHGDGDIAARVDGRIGRIERPPGVDAAH
jgi:hypothetical protein